MLGGSSSLNGSTVCARSTSKITIAGLNLGNIGWCYDDVLPYFKKSEDQEHGENEYHGVGGPLKVSDLRLRRKIAEQFIKAASEIGIPKNPDYNGAENQEGVAYFQQTAYKGFRWSTAKGFLKPALNRENLELVTRAQVVKVNFEKNKAVGIEYIQNGELKKASTAKEIVLSAGAIGSPQILQCSGIGNGSLLQSLDIPVINDLPGVGECLQDHLQVRLVHKTNQPTLNDEVNNPIRKMWIGMQYMLNRTGPMTLAASQVCIFTKSNPNVERPDIQFHMQPLSADKPGDGPHKFSAFTSSVCQLRPESRGYVKIKSPDALAYPEIQPNYLSTELDRNTAVDGVKVARAIAAAPALRDYITDEFVPGRQYQSDEELLEAVRLHSQTIYHPTSTCKMGSDEMSVVDSRLKVRGVEGLRVVDASIMPEIVSGNTNAPTIMIAEKGSDMILEDNR